MNSEIRSILDGTPLIDGHNDLAEQLRDRVRNRLDRLDLAGDTGALEPPMQTDVARLRRGGVGGEFFAAYVPYALTGPAAIAAMFEQIDVIRRVTARHADAFVYATSADEIDRAHYLGRIAALIGVEGGHGIGNSMAILRHAHACGARYLTLTHLLSTDWADAALWPGVGNGSIRHGGLSAFGREVVREMNRLGMMVDLSHVADETMRAAIETSEAPVIWSHSSARALCNHARNVPDDVLRTVPGNGGIVMVNFIPTFISEEAREWGGPAWAERALLEKLYPGEPIRVETEYKGWKQQHPPPPVTLTQVADHIDHVRRVAGVEHVGIGSDFDGNDIFPSGLEDTSCFPALLEELLRRGYTAEEIGMVAGGNILRVMRRAEAVARRLQETRPPSDARIEDLDPPSDDPLA